MNYYKVHDLNIASEIPIPEFVPGGTGGDIVVRLGRRKPLNGHKLGWEDLTRQTGLLRTEHGSFSLDEGREVLVTPATSDREVLRMYLLGGIMAALLYQRGLLPIHASAVSIGGEAALFVGEQGRGKSTLAASFYGRGHQVLADDVAAIAVRETGCTVTPAFPLVKLFPAVGERLGCDSASHLFLHELESKRGLPVEDRFCAQPTPLGGIFLLARGERPALHAVPPETSLLALLQHSCPTRLNLPGDEAHFLACAKVARETPVFRLERPHPTEQLPTVCTLVESAMEHAGDLVSV